MGGANRVSTDVREIWRLATQANLLIHRMTHRRDALEQIFLQAVGHLETAAVPLNPAGDSGAQAQIPLPAALTDV